MIMERDRPPIDKTYDLIVIGGGINGAGVARDAALRGLSTILVEKGDFCSGTTSWSTRLIHGGLRYLEYFEFALVKESLQEREILLHMAPHLVKPLLLTIPIYRDRSRPSWKIQAGMALYDILSSGKTLPSHRMLSRRQFQQLFPSIDSDHLVGGAQYYDAQVACVERLVLENILAAKAAGAIVLNYVEVTQLHGEHNRITSLSCRDHLTGEAFILRGSDNAVIVNTAGPWVDQVLSRCGHLGSQAKVAARPKIGGTKGSHIIVDLCPGMPQESALYVEARSDGRPLFMVPWWGRLLIGTTDIPYSGDLERVKADNTEIDYLLHETNQIIPVAQLCRQDVKFTYAGVRPLPYSEGQNPGSITRRHLLYDHQTEGIGNLFSLVGGKITTYRQVGQEIVEAVYRKQGRIAPACLTAQQPLPGAILPQDERVQQAMADYQPQLSTRTIAHLFSLYGARATEVLAITEAEPALAEAIQPPLPDIKAQIVYAVQSEFAHTLLDIACRRTLLAMQGDYGLTALATIGHTLEKYCGWSQAACDRQIGQYQHYMATHCIPDYALPHPLG